MKVRNCRELPPRARLRGLPATTGAANRPGLVLLSRQYPLPNGYINLKLVFRMKLMILISPQRLGHCLGIFPVGHLLLRERGAEDILDQTLTSMTVSICNLQSQRAGPRLPVPLASPAGHGPRVLSD